MAPFPIGLKLLNCLPVDQESGEYWAFQGHDLGDFLPLKLAHFFEKYIQMPCVGGGEGGINFGIE